MTLQELFAYLSQSQQNPNYAPGQVAGQGILGQGLKNQAAQIEQQTGGASAPQGLLGVSPKDSAGFAIDTSRPSINNSDGSFSTERTITVGMDGRYFNIPTIWGGKQLEPQAAIQLARQSLQAGGTFPNFGSQDAAVKAAVARSSDIGNLRGPSQTMSPPPASGAGQASKEAIIAQVLASGDKTRIAQLKHMGWI